MEVSWSTFILEIVNFVVLVWILKHFLYRPVLDIIARRKAAIDRTLSEAGTLKTEAADMRRQYEGRLGAWEQERQAARDTLNSEMEAKRRECLQKLEAELAAARQRAEVADARRLAEARRTMEVTALQQGAAFAARLLRLGAGADTQCRLLQLLLDELNELPPETAKAIRQQYGESKGEALIHSALPLSAEQRQALEQALNGLLPAGTSLHFDTEPALLAGVRITAGAWQLGANVQDELHGFAELARHE
ncbi:F0F1 ATP synthase subunit delta [Oceanimonas baumannii]|uniref:F0F1 ATP synthase subunit delta n=1 Tax=Oceanimonas baumannii TaxID=129578 RepID=UPI001D1895E9|nr:F0F1 ATP synthase subunit delta [Oceanimonas baumannii]MCC4265061.1 F0F1 ATP synthase subunit delta [Oceanimonas baumannii]